MATPVIMPKQGQSVETCVITAWLKNTGDTVKTGDILCTYETDKASFDLESPADGTILEIFFSEGREVPVLANIAVIGSEGESTSQFRAGDVPVPAGKTTENDAASALSIIAGRADMTSSGQPDGRLRISPRARRMAREKNADITTLKGSGPAGRIVVKDIEEALKGMSPVHHASDERHGGSQFTDRPLSNIRRIIAAAMHESLQSSAQLTHHMSADARRILEARKRLKEAAAPGRDLNSITLNDMICFCVIRALSKWPEANSHFLGGSIRTFSRVHLGLAVDTSRGLMVPAIRNADTMSLQVLSKELKEAAEACRKGNINPELLKSTAASFTVSNLGAYGVEMFTPVLNLPQVAILGLCTIVHRPADIGNGVIGLIPVIGLSLTYDHRAIDGGPATLFLKEIKEQIEKFEPDLIQ